MIPNLIELEENAKKKAIQYLYQKQKIDNYQWIDTDINVWRQLWGDTSAGASKDKHYIAGCAMTYGYITFITVTVNANNKQYIVYTVYYNGEKDKGFIALEEEIDKSFFDDVKKHCIKPLWEAFEKY